MSEYKPLTAQLLGAWIETTSRRSLPSEQHAAYLVYANAVNAAREAAIQRRLDV